MKIELTERETKLLAEFAAKQYEGAKDNIGTKTPIHVVERLEKIFIPDDSDETWICEDNDYQEYQGFDSMIDALRSAGKDLPPYDGVEYEEVNDVWIDDQQAYLKAYEIHAQSGRFINTYRPVAFFLIRDEAVRYKDGYQSHNCGDCRIYTYGLGYSNNGDLPVFRELLMRMGAQLREEENGDDAHTL